MWLPFSIGSYFLSGLAAVIDKALLRSRIPDPLVYAFYTGILSVGVIVLTPLGFTLFPLNVTLLALSAGATLMVAYYFFYRAMRSFEASRVVPLTAGVFTPILTLIISWVMFGSLLETHELSAFILFVIGGLFLMVNIGEHRLSLNYLLLASTFTAGLFFAVSFSVTNEVFEISSGLVDSEIKSFVSGFVWMRLGSFFLAVFILLIPVLRRSIFSSNAAVRRSSLGIFLTNKIIGALGFLMLNYAIFLGSENLVISLKGIEYLFVFVLSLFFSIFIPSIIKESLKIRVVAQKIIGVIIIGAGLFLYTFPLK